MTTDQKQQEIKAKALLADLKASDAKKLGKQLFSILTIFHLIASYALSTAGVNSTYYWLLFAAILVIASIYYYRQHDTVMLKTIWKSAIASALAFLAVTLLLGAFSSLLGKAIL